MGDERKELVKRGFTCVYFSHFFFFFFKALCVTFKALSLQCSMLRLTLVILVFDFN